MRGVSWLAEWLSASQGLCSRELVTGSAIDSMNKAPKYVTFIAGDFYTLHELNAVCEPQFVGHRIQYI
jgi:hypothetical protein